MEIFGNPDPQDPSSNKRQGRASVTWPMIVKGSVNPKPMGSLIMSV